MSNEKMLSELILYRMKKLNIFLIIKAGLVKNRGWWLFIQPYNIRKEMGAWLV